MTQDTQQVRTRTPPLGVGLALLALAIQVLLPFLVTADIALLSKSAYADTAIICSAGVSHAPSSAPAPDQKDHGGTCPLCLALATGQGFTSAAPLAIPLPLRAESIVLDAASPRLAFAAAATSYNPRAPPVIG